MKPDIHPAYQQIEVNCSCGNQFQVRSTYPEKVLAVEVCSACHPFYTGKHKLLGNTGQVDKFRRRYGNKDATAK